MFQNVMKRGWHLLVVTNRIVQNILPGRSIICYISSEKMNKSNWAFLVYAIFGVLAIGCSPHHLVVHYFAEVFHKSGWPGLLFHFCLLALFLMLLGSGKSSK